MSKPEQDRLTAAALGAFARRAVERTLESEAASRARLLARVGSRSPHANFGLKGWLGVPALAALAALVVWWRVPSALTYEVSGVETSDSYVSAPPDHTVLVHFSDETRVQVEPGSQLRIEEADRRGARVLLERGTAAVHVVHRPRAHWTFVAGPFEVLVTGTVFDLHWDPAGEHLDLKLREGSVEVSTPLGSSPVRLHGGQELSVDLHSRTLTTVDPGLSRAPSPSAPAPVTASASSGSVEAAPEPSASALPAPFASSALAPSVAPQKSWSKLVAGGEFKALLREANERGVGNCARTCSASDLSALADAARYTGHANIADQSLRALRARFLKEPEGRAAAFLLGRQREGLASAADARAWYDRYLSESPSGPYAAEAHAGKMRVVSKLEGKAAAAPLAQEYLRRYPTGVQAGTARGILDLR